LVGLFKNDRLLFFAELSQSLISLASSKGHRLKPHAKRLPILVMSIANFNRWYKESLSCCSNPCNKQKEMNHTLFFQIIMPGIFALLIALCLSAALG
jgi:hypothetical protein